jgi:hypothetical protein
MKTAIQLANTKECYILCHIFQCRIEDVLSFYVRHVSISSFLKNTADEKMELATYFFIKYTCESE